MKKISGIFVLLVFLLAIVLPVFAATINQQVQRLENEVSFLQGKLAKTKSPAQIARLKKTIKGDQAKIEELKKDPSYGSVKLEITKVQIVEQSQKTKIFTVKGGLAGGAGLVAMEYLMPMGPRVIGGEAGYAMGSGFGAIEAAIKVLHPLGNHFVGLELSYAGYSKDVTSVPGLSGVIKSGVGIGIIGGTSFGPIRVSTGYNTILGLKADAGYRINI